MRPALPTAVLGLLVVVVGFFSGAVALIGPAALDGLVDRFYLFSAVVAVSCAVLAYVVWRHDPANRIATIAIVVAWANAGSLLLERYALSGVARDWPAVGWALWVSQWVWMPALLAVPTVLALRFPDGRLPSPRWRPLEVTTLGLLVLVTAAFALTPYGELDQAPRLDLPHPAQVAGAQAVFAVAMPATGLAALGCLASLVARMRRSRGVERVQLQWGLAGLLATVALVGLSVALGDGAAWVALVGVAVLPLSIGVAVLRHGLFDVGRVLNRSLVYGALTAAILAVYAVTVGLLGDVLGRTVGAPLVATGVVALGAEPARRWLQGVANRVVYGQREDPYDVLVRLGEQLSGPVDHAAALDGVAASVTRALRLRGAAVVVDGRDVAAHGELVAPWTDVPLLGPDGRQAGALRVSTAPGHELTARDWRLLGDLSHHVSAALQARHLHAEVEASRARLVVAREEERRRIRQDLHDGLGPTLAAMALEVERAGLDLGRDPAAAADRLEEVAARIRGTVRDVRALVEDLRPPSLDELGLPGAVRELARSLGKGSLAIEVCTEGDADDLPAAVSLAAYRIVGEAVTNVLRHASAATCRIHLARSATGLRISVSDDGVGLGRPAGGGLGIGSMRSRAAEIGGWLEVTGRPGGGTTVFAELPVEAP